MELPTIRSQFIQTNLRRVLHTTDETQLWKVAYEFRRYFEWFAGSLGEADREAISYQLGLLEDSCQRKQIQASTGSIPR